MSRNLKNCNCHCICAYRTFIIIISSFFFLIGIGNYYCGYFQQNICNPLSCSFVILLFRFLLFGS